eukprot:5890319-Pyramimonas_sp.AAC.1
MDFPSHPARAQGARISDGMMPHSTVHPTHPQGQPGHGLSPNWWTRRWRAHGGASHRGLKATSNASKPKTEKAKLGPGRGCACRTCPSSRTLPRATGRSARRSRRSQTCPPRAR